MFIIGKVCATAIIVALTILALPAPATAEPGSLDPTVTAPELPVVSPAAPASSPPPPPNGLGLRDIIGQLGGADGIDPASVLSQRPLAADPAGDPPSPFPLDPLNNAYLLPQNLEPAAPGQGIVAGIEPGHENDTIRYRDYLRRLWNNYQDGDLAGAMLGQNQTLTPGAPVPPAPHEPPGPAPCPDHHRKQQGLESFSDR